VAKKKIAILGGGIGGLATAFELSAQPGWRDRYEITVYQMGWRLGGQGATGRNPEHHERVEEHGLHFWGGFYENAFMLMRACYAELGRQPGQPLATIWEAFQPQPFWVVTEYLDGKWSPWPHPAPTNDERPGDGRVLSPWGHVKLALEELITLVENSPHSPFCRESNARAVPTWVSAVLHRFGLFGHPPTVVEETVTVSVQVPPEAASAHPEHGFLRQAHAIARALPDDPADHPDDHHRVLAWLLKEFRVWFLNRLVAGLARLTSETRRLFIVVDLVVAALAGVLEENVLNDGFGKLDAHELTDWLRKHGATEMSLGSAMIRGYYDYFFAYSRGELDRPRLAAGTALWHMARLLLDYKGAIWWKMVAGMGDTIFAPLYQVLERRGVAFKLFHRVEALRPADDGRGVASIDVQVQATLKDPGRPYQPLREVKGLPVWPNAPLFDQLVEGEALKARGINLEDPWADWPGVGRITLRRGEDFDDVVLATSMAPMPFLTRELMAVSEPWREMVQNVATVQTLAIQLWLRPTLAQLGWGMPRPLLSGYAQPLNTGSDMAHVIPYEDWPADAAPGSLLYFCGPLPDAEPMPPFTDHAFPAREARRVRQIALQWITDNTTPLFPKATTPLNPTALDWNLLAAPDDVSGSARLDEQYYRANIGFTQRYVLSEPGATAYRFKGGRSPFENLYLAGDFVFTMLGGCVEGAAMAGRMASRAISGYPEVIPGEVVR
jgi:uncharacterized protein with NAD-binding domain and iron-sulfur cluster